MSDILIIKPKWLNKIFHNGKCLEIRGSNTTKRGAIELAESGTSLIRGCCELQHAYPIEDEEHWEQLKEFHQVDISWNELLKRYKHPYAWVFINVKEYKTPIQYIHPKGAVIWVKK
jgi:hypothetical protein